MGGSCLLIPRGAKCVSEACWLRLIEADLSSTLPAFDFLPSCIQWRRDEGDLDVVGSLASRKQALLARTAGASGECLLDSF